MVNKIKTVLYQLHIRKVKTDYALANLIDQLEIIDNLTRFKSSDKVRIIAFSVRNRICYNDEYCIYDMLDLGIKLRSCKMIVFLVDDIDSLIRIKILQKVKNLCSRDDCHGAIVDLKEDGIFLFPFIHYQDTYLLKYILSEQLSYKNIQVRFLGCNNNLVLV